MSKAYKQSGVGVHVGYEVVERMSSHIQRTVCKEVFGGSGGFGATFDLSQSNMKIPVLVSGTNGVGTKLKPTIDHNKHNTIGTDAVAMYIDDIPTTGVEPLYSLDYIATNKVAPEVMEQIVEGVSDGCEATHTALIDGEITEMGETYYEGEYDLANSAVEAVEKDEHIDGSEVEEGQIIIGLASNGIHSNGYSLVRKLIEESGINLNSSFDGSAYLDILLASTQLYVKPILTLKEKVKIKGVNHITGGGFYENVPRGLPKGLAAKIDAQSFPTPKVSEWLRQQVEIETSEMYSIFSVGIGYTIAVNKEDVYKTLDVLKEQDIAAHQIGEIVKSNDAPTYPEGV